MTIVGHPLRVPDAAQVLLALTETRHLRPRARPEVRGTATDPARYRSSPRDRA